MDWETLIAAGVSLASGLLQDDRRESELAQSKDNLLLQLQDRERDRLAALERQQLSADTSLQAAQLSLEGAKKKILGDALLNKGKASGAAMLESFRSSANKPERFNTAANNLAALLATRR
jgi:hypothetical protein